MVVPLGPGKFYGSSLPRPRIYTDVKFNTERVDPPVSVVDSFLSWANEAHWSMGGLSHKRLRLQGRIEGNVSKLRKEQEKIEKVREKQISKDSAVIFGDGNKKGGSSSVSPPAPAAPMATKRRRYLALSDDEDEEDEQEKVRVSHRRKLEDDFDRVADENVTGMRTRSKGLEKNVVVSGAVKEKRSEEEKKKVKSGKSEIRTSPRLAKRESR